MTTTLPDGLAPSASLELVVGLADGEAVVNALRFPGVAMVATEIRQHGTTRTQPERPVDESALDAALLALLARVGDVPAGTGLDVTFRRAGRVELKRSLALAVARGDRKLADALDTLWAMAGESDPDLAAALTAAWAGA